MKYEVNQDVIIRQGKLTGYRGWIAENDNHKMARLGMPYEIIFYDNCPVHSEWMSEEYLMSANDLAGMQAENERLKAALESIKVLIQEWASLDTTEHDDLRLIGKIDDIVSQSEQPS